MTRAGFVMLLWLGVFASAAAEDVCIERRLLDQVMSAQHFELEVRETDDALSAAIVEAYRLVQPLAHFLYENRFEDSEIDGHRQRIREALVELDRGPEMSAQELYAAMILSSTLARLALVRHQYVRAGRHGRNMLKLVRRYASLRPDDHRADLFLAVHDYHRARLPLVLRPFARLFGGAVDVSATVRRIETVAELSPALGPEAARILLAEIRSDDRPACRYVYLAESLAAAYPGNQSIERLARGELAGCPVSALGSDPELPQLAPSC